MLFIPSVARPFVLLVAEITVCNPRLDHFQSAHWQIWKQSHQICLCQCVPQCCIVVSDSSQSKQPSVQGERFSFWLARPKHPLSAWLCFHVRRMFSLLWDQTSPDCRWVYQGPGSVWTFWADGYLPQSGTSEADYAHLLSSVFITAGPNFICFFPPLNKSSHSTSANICHKVSACFFRLTNIVLISTLGLCVIF